MGNSRSIDESQKSDSQANLTYKIEHTPESTKEHLEQKNEKCKVPVATSLVTVNHYSTTIPYILPLLNVVPCVLSRTYLWVSKSVKQLFVGQEYDKQKVTDALEKLQSTLTFLDTKMSRLNENIMKYTSEAKRLYACKNKPAAIHQLRLKKMYEREVAKMDSLKFNIESNILHMESVGVMMETVSTIKETSHQFQIVFRHVDINKLEDCIEEMFEQRDTSKDIENILNDMHDAHDYDEDELIEELESLVLDDNASVKINTPHPPPETSHNALILNMPTAPSTAILNCVEDASPKKKNLLHEHTNVSC